MMKEENTKNEAAIVMEFQNGSQQAFSILYDSYINKLLNYGCRLTTDRELLKDCIHDVFVKLYTHRNDSSVIQNFKSYLFISLKNKIYDELRKKSFESESEINESTFSMLSDKGVEEEYISEESKMKSHLFVKNLLSKLSPRQREAIKLYYMEGKKYDEICKIMEMNYQSVRNLMHRGILRLREYA